MVHRRENLQLQRLVLHRRSWAHVRDMQPDYGPDLKPVFACCLVSFPVRLLAGS